MKNSAWLHEYAGNLRTGLKDVSNRDQETYNWGMMIAALVEISASLASIAEAIADQPHSA